MALYLNFDPDKTTLRSDARPLLLAQGIAPSRLSPSSFGPTRPLADNATEAGRARNRRVELVRE